MLNTMIKLLMLNTKSTTETQLYLTDAWRTQLATNHHISSFAKHIKASDF